MEMLVVARGAVGMMWGAMGGREVVGMVIVVGVGEGVDSRLSLGTGEKKRRIC